MSTSIYPTNPEVQVMFAKARLNPLLPQKVLDRIREVSEEYMVDRQRNALKIRFSNGVWSIPLFVEDRSLFQTMDEWDYSEVAINKDEFLVDCLMKFEAGDGLL